MPWPAPARRTWRTSARSCAATPPACRRRLAAMEVKGIRWVGVGTDRLAAMRSFAVDVLGLRLVGEDRADFVELAMADGAKLELFGSADAPGGEWVVASQPGGGRVLVRRLQGA